VNVIWPESARSELRAVDRENAMRILLAPTRYAESGAGDIRHCPVSGMDTAGCESETSVRIVPEEMVIVRIRHSVRRLPIEMRTHQDSE